jgi:hypothetical protein
LQRNASMACAARRNPHRPAARCREEPGRPIVQWLLLDSPQGAVMAPLTQLKLHEVLSQPPHPAIDAVQPQPAPRQPVNLPKKVHREGSITSTSIVMNLPFDTFTRVFHNMNRCFTCIAR